MNRLVIVYEIDFDLLEAENEKDEKYVAEFPTQQAFKDWLYENEKEKVSNADISKAIKKGYVVLGKYLIFKVDEEFL